MLRFFCRWLGLVAGGGGGVVVRVCSVDQHCFLPIPAIVTGDKWVINS